MIAGAAIVVGLAFVPGTAVAAPAPAGAAGVFASPAATSAAPASAGLVPADIPTVPSNDGGYPLVSCGSGNDGENVHTVDSDGGNHQFECSYDSEIGWYWIEIVAA